MRLILGLVLTVHCVSAQQAARQADQPAARKLDALHDLSANLEALSLVSVEKIVTAAKAVCYRS